MFSGRQLQLFLPQVVTLHLAVIRPPATPPLAVILLLLVAIPLPDTAHRATALTGTRIQRTLTLPPRDIHGRPKNVRHAMRSVIYIFCLFVERVVFTGLECTVCKRSGHIWSSCPNKKGFHHQLIIPSRFLSVVVSQPKATFQIRCMSAVCRLL